MFLKSSVEGEKRETLFVFPLYEYEFWPISFVYGEKEKFMPKKTFESILRYDKGKIFIRKQWMETRVI